MATLTRAANSPVRRTEGEPHRKAGGEIGDLGDGPAARGEKFFRGGDGTARKGGGPIFPKGGREPRPG